MTSRFIDIAAKLAASIPYKRQQKRVAAVISTKRGVIVAAATNSYEKTHPEMKRAAVRCGLDEKIYLHAEVAAILKDTDNLGYRISIASVNKKGELTYAAPCKICLSVLKRTKNIKVVEFSM